MIIPRTNNHTTEDPAHPLSPMAYACVREMLGAYYRIFHCAKLRGRDNIPATGPVIVAPNHVSYYDPPLVGMAIPRQIRTMAWNALFRVPLLGWAMKKLGAFAVDPKQADSAAYRQTMTVLNHGDCIVIFPEGRRGLGRELEPFETGVARLAIRSGAIIVPATLTGVFEAWPRWQKIPRLFKPMQIKFHRPIHPQDFFQPGGNMREAITALTAEIRKPIERRWTAYLRLMARKNRRLPTPPSGLKI